MQTVAMKSGFVDKSFTVKLTIVYLRKEKIVLDVGLRLRALNKKEKFCFNSHHVYAFSSLLSNIYVACRKC